MFSLTRSLRSGGGSTSFSALSAINAADRSATAARSDSIDAKAYTRRPPMNTEGAGTLEIGEPSSSNSAPDSTPVHRAGPRALIVNAYATGNRGDAAIVEGIVDSLRRAGYATVAVAPVDWRDPSPWVRLGVDEVVPPLISLLDAPSWARRWKP